ncbi:MAG: flagellin, partial [Candidatus Sericytochromatia bacterium]
MIIDPLGSSLRAKYAPLIGNISKNQRLIDQTLERLSTGLRLNHASDSPVDYSRARRLDTRLQSNHQAQTNSQQSSLLFDHAADGAGSIINSLQRIRELTLLSMTGTTSDTDRAGIQKEVNQLVQNIQRVSDTTVFNGRNLLNGSTSAPRAARAAWADVLENRKITNSSGSKVDFLSQVLSVDPGVLSSAIEFELYQSSPGVTGLKVRSSNLGDIATYTDVSTLGSSLTIPVNSLGGPGITVALPSLGTGGSALTQTEVQTSSIQSLVSSGKLNTVTYGQLNLTLGGTAYNNVIDVQGTTKIQDVLDAINALSPSNGTVLASFDPVTSKISVDFTGQDTLTQTTHSVYNPGIPSA